jgi:uncharacterized protein DUF3105
VAKKSRTPPPPRRPGARRTVQAPRARAGDGTADRRRFVIPIALAAAGVLGLAAVLALFAFGGGDSAPAPEALRAAGCTLEIVPVRYPGGEGQAAGQRHVERLPAGYRYPSFPATAGPHHPVPAPFDVYDDPVEQIRLVHNLEHGGVVIQYGRRVPEQTVAEIVEWYRDGPNGIVIAPLPALGSTIALAAWNADLSSTGELRSERGVLAKCPRFDEAAFDAFMDDYAFQGPERFPEEQLAPGF